MQSPSPAVVDSKETYQIRVLGPDKHAVAVADLTRLFRDAALSPGRGVRVMEGPCLVAVCGERVVGAAAYHRTDMELRVTDLGVSPDCDCRRENIVCALLDALELACLAGGSDRLVLRVPDDLPGSLLQRRGYLMTNGCEGRWADKSYPKA
ncbi:MAG: hypothetical protein HYZ58_10900 [Acidobacteria bacterium]|nr:hypothetical protein [Acidobacteriota bacterium]MBI3263640.1 hypothetical protein [Acidobacteriota bacterium]